MKKLLLSLMMVAAFAVGNTAKAATIERDSDGDLTINVFASIIESFRVTIENADIVLAGAAPAADGLLDLNGGMAGFDGLQSLIAPVGCKDDSGAGPVYLDTVKTKCAIINGGNSSNSSLKFDVDFAVKVELSGPGSIDLDVAFQPGTQGDSSFQNRTILFDNSTASLSALVDQASHNLHFYGEAPFSGGPSYDDTIVVTVTKN